MNAVQQTIRLLVVILFANNARCQDGYNERDIMRFSQMANEASQQMGAINNYNLMQRSPTSQALSSVNMQYVAEEIDAADDFNRADKTRTRKVYRIKNPFQQQEDNNQQQDGITDPNDSGTGASNQYATMQYSLPPEEFLQQMRAESQYYQQQQQQQQQQHSTPAPSIGYTVTPQPQYQYSTISPLYDNSNQQPNQIPQMEPKSHTQYLTNNYQYNAPNNYNLDSSQSTPSPVTSYVSTALPNNQLVGTPANSYVSSSSPIFLSSPPNLQYVSSPLTAVQTGSPDYIGNRVTSTIGSNSLSYDNNDQNKKIQIDHYDNSIHGVRYPNNLQRQYQNEYISSTQSPSSSYPDPREPWNNNPGVTAMPKSLQDISYTQYQSYPFNHQENRADSNLENIGTDTHRNSDMASANNMYYNILHADIRSINNGKNRARDVEHETAQPTYYSNGEYGWKVSDKKPTVSNDAYASPNYQRYQTQNDNGQAVSQMTFHMDTSKQYYDSIAKANQDNIDAQEFAKAAARAHESMKQQQNLYNNGYENNYNTQTNNQAVSVNQYYNNLDKQKNKYEPPNYYSPQPDLVTASPYFYNSRENNIDNKPKLPFDHAKALKNIVPIDVSNVVSESQSKAAGDNINRYIQNYEKDQIDQNRQNYRTLTDAYYKDKNSIYGFNIKSKPEDFITAENSKLYDPNNYYNKQQQTQETSYQNNYANVRPNYITSGSSNLPDNVQSPGNIQSQTIHRQQTQLPTDINSILKLNDVPYQLTQGLSPDSLKFQNSNFDRGNIPSQLPFRINQDVGTHQLDVTTNLLSKLMLNKQPGLALQRPEIDPQAGMLSTINGFKVANPFNVDLKLVAEMLKGKSAADDTHIMSLRDHQFNKASPMKLDLSQLQLLLKNDNPAPINDIGVLSSPFLEIYNTGRFPYQGVKYSRSQEEEESLVPIADASSNHPIGAVIEQDDPNNEREDGTVSETTGEESLSQSHDEDRIKKPYFSGHRSVNDRHRHPNALIGRHPFQRKYPKSGIEEPYRLLKPPPLNSFRGRDAHVKLDRHGRRRRVNRPKVFRIMKAEPLFEAESEDENADSVPVVLRPPAPVIEAKSDVVVNEGHSDS